jgi:hypothetical protein
MNIRIMSTNDYDDVYNLWINTPGIRSLYLVSNIKTYLLLFSVSDIVFTPRE